MGNCEETSMFPSHRARFLRKYVFSSTESACSARVRVNLAAVSLSALNCVTRGRNYFARLGNNKREGENPLYDRTSLWNNVRQHVYTLRNPLG